MLSFIPQYKRLIWLRDRGEGRRVEEGRGRRAEGKKEEGEKDEDENENICRSGDITQVSRYVFSSNLQE